MFRRLKSYLKRYTGLVVLYSVTHNVLQEIADVYDSIWSSTLSAPRNLFTTHYGFKLCVGRSVGHREMQLGVFEPEETEFIKSHLAQADVFVDVGANIGLYTCLARSLGKHTIAIEPQVKNLRFLYANLIENAYRDVEVYPIGLSDQIGLGLLYGASATGASLVAGRDRELLHFRSTIPITTLDILLGQRLAGQKILIKIDVEGAEYYVLRGAQSTLNRSPRPTWLVEILLNEYQLPVSNPNYTATFDLFWQYGYEAHTANRPYRLIRPADVNGWVKAQHCDSGTINYIFTPMA